MPFPIKDFVLNEQIPNATDATNQIVFVAPFDCELDSVQSRHRTASTSGTMDVVRAASGTAVSAGTSLLTATMSLSGTADTNVSGSLSSSIGGKTITKGQALGLVFGGTLTNLVDLDVTVLLRQLKNR